LIISGKLSGDSTNISQGATLLSVIFPSYGIMAHWEQMYPSIDFRSFQGYPNYFDTKWLNNSPTFLGLPAPHIVNFLEYLSEIKLGGEDALIKLFLLTLPSYLQNRFKSCCKDRGISSFIHLISRFIDLTKPDCQTYEDVLQNLMVTLDHKGFTTEIVEDLRRAYHDQYQESSDIRDEVYEDHYQPLEEEQDLSHNPIECNKDITRDVNYEDEAPVTAPQSDEALQDPIPPAQDEENEVSHFPFSFLMIPCSMTQRVKKNGTLGQARSPMSQD
jgi:hypothetical protein